MVWLSAVSLCILGSIMFPVHWSQESSFWHKIWVIVLIYEIFMRLSVFCPIISLIWTHRVFSNIEIDINVYSLTKGPVFWKFSAKNKDVEKIFYLVTYCIRLVKHWTQFFFQLRLFHDCVEACILRNGNVSCHKKYKNMFFVWNSLYW